MLITDHSYHELHCPVWSYLAKRDRTPLIHPVINEAALPAWTLLWGLPREPYTPTGTKGGFPRDNQVFAMESKSHREPLMG